MSRKSIGRNLQAKRQAKPWTIDDLVTASGVSEKTIRRIESGTVMPKQDTIAKLAAALDTDADSLLNGLASEDVEELVSEFACADCGAPLAHRVPVQHEYGDDQLDVFECGAERGWRERPCPQSPSFPRFEDYDLTFIEDGDAVSCFARGRTEGSKAVDLRVGHGATRSLAERWVLRSYLEARDGHAAAEKAVPLHELIA